MSITVIYHTVSDCTVYHGGKITFDEMIYTLYTVVEFNSASSLKIICPRVDMSVHSDTLSLIRANQSLLLLLNAACLSEKQHIIDNTTDMSQVADI
jgi:hypothetical protein